MNYKMKMPDLSTTEDEIHIIEWYVQAGDFITRGQAICAVETDKATMDVESAVSGTLKEIIIGNDQDIATGQVIAVIDIPNPSQ